MTRPSTSVPFTETRIPYAGVFCNTINHDLTGVIVLYHVKTFQGHDDIVPLFVGYGNIFSTLRELENQLKFLAFDPIYYDYIDSPGNPQLLVEALRRIYNPMLRN